MWMARAPQIAGISGDTVEGSAEFIARKTRLFSVLGIVPQAPLEPTAAEIRYIYRCYRTFVKGFET